MSRYLDRVRQLAAAYQLELWCNNHRSVITWICDACDIYSLSLHQRKLGTCILNVNTPRGILEKQLTPIGIDESQNSGKANWDRPLCLFTREAADRGD